MIPTEFVVDASIFVASALSEEPQHAGAFAFLEAAVQAQITRLAPAIIAAEVMGAIARRTGRPLLARRFFAVLRARPEFVVLPVDATLGDEAGEVAALQGIKGCDAIYVALARTRAIPLITLDREQQERAPDDVEVLAPEQALAKWWALKQNARPLSAIAYSQAAEGSHRPARRCEVRVNWLQGRTSRSPGCRVPEEHPQASRTATRPR